MPLRPIKALTDLIKSNIMSNMVIVEVGTHSGDTSVDYLPILKSINGKSILIDWFLGSEGVVGPHAQGLYTHDQLLDMLKVRIQQIGCEDMVAIYDCSSLEAATRIDDDSIDICFIDADHRYEHVKKDIMAYLPKVKENGFLCGHDCEGFKYVNTFSSEELNTDYCHRGSCHAGVVQAVYESFGNDVSLVADPYGQNVPIWIHKKKHISRYSL